MGWFDEQIRQRKQHDSEALGDAFARMARAASGGRAVAAVNDSGARAKNAMDEILKYYHVRSREVPESIKDNDGRLEYLMRPHGIMRRTVRLEEGWSRDASGAMLAAKRGDGSIVALIPAGFWGYRYLDEDSGKRVRITKRNEGLFDPEAVAFYKPLPIKKLRMRDLIRCMADTFRIWDFLLVALAAFAVALLGMVAPSLNNLIFSDVIDSGNMRLLAALAIFMACTSVSGAMFCAVRNLATDRIAAKADMTVESAVMMRLLSLPADFFRKYGAGELSFQAGQIGFFCRTLIQTAFTAVLSAVCALVYLVQIFAYAPTLFLLAAFVVASYVLLSVVLSWLQAKESSRQMETDSKESGMGYAMISSIQKIRLSGAEKRAFARWGNLYAESAEITYRPPFLLKMGKVASLAISLAGTYAIYYAAVKSQVPVADYYAFYVAYGMVSGAFLELSSALPEAAKMKPALDLAKPILTAEPEIASEKHVLERISGGIELSNVSFRYNEHMPPVLDDVSLKIRPGQYVAVTGATGCGKSTLMRLMLGFERPQKGAVYYDGKDISTVDLKSLRQKIGVVLQDGKLFSGDIYSNITILDPKAGLDRAWEAAEIAGVADDIRNMPMGMFTMVSEGGGISGGQRQRLLIARAVAAKPRILMFDEATSALDNLTQKKVSEALSGMKCTRIVIAHRLSTIRQCDRILVLDRGKIVGDGKYEKLLAENSFFADLVAKQRLDDK